MEENPEGRFLAVVGDPISSVSLLERVASGERLRDVAKSWDVSHGRLLRWLGEDEKRYEGYKRALELGSYELVEDALEIADGEGREAVYDSRGNLVDPYLPRDKLRVETKFRVAAARNRGVYGEAVQTTGAAVRSSITVIVNRGGAGPAVSGSGVSGLVIDGEVEV